ncbi:MAG TPA: hypothetical protein VF951_10370, partial [Streptosporangiaceae bacterium]
QDTQATEAESTPATHARTTESISSMRNRIEKRIGKRRAKEADAEQQDAEQQKQADLAKLTSLRQEAQDLHDIIAQPEPDSESSAQAAARAESIAGAEARLPAVEEEIAGLVARGVGVPEPETPAQRAERLEQDWRESVARGREQFPSGRAASRPDLSFAEASAEVEQHAAAARDEARRQYWDPFDPQGAAAYAAYHAELARIHRWNMILDDLGIGHPEPEAEAPGEQGTGEQGTGEHVPGGAPGDMTSTERSELLTRLHQTERMLQGMLAGAERGPGVWDLTAQRDGLHLAEAQLRRVQAEIDLFTTDSLPDDLNQLDQERQRLENIPGLLELPFAGPTPGSFRADRIQLAQSRLREVQAKIAAVRQKLAQELAATVRQQVRERIATAQFLEQERQRLTELLQRLDNIQLARELPFADLRSGIGAQRIPWVRRQLAQVQDAIAELPGWLPGTPPPGQMATVVQKMKQARQQKQEQDRLRQAQPRGQGEVDAKKIAAIRARQERDWQQWVAAAQRDRPAAEPPARPGPAPTLAQTYAELERSTAAAANAASEAYWADPEGRQDYVQFHAEQGSDRTLRTLQADLGIDVPATELRDQLTVAGPIDPATLPPELTPDAAAAWVQEREKAAATEALLSYPGKIGSEEHMAYVTLMADQARESAWSAALAQ